MSRAKLDVPVPSLALRRAEAAAACSVSVEICDEFIRLFVPAVRLNDRVTLYPTRRCSPTTSLQGSGPQRERRLSLRHVGARAARAPRPRLD
jgi:hypothetical protein